MQTGVQNNNCLSYVLMPPQSGEDAIKTLSANKSKGYNANEKQNSYRFFEHGFNTYADNLRFYVRQYKHRLKCG